MTIIPLTCSAMLAFHPTIDGARQSLGTTYTETPYVLGVSVPPPDHTELLITQGDMTLFVGEAWGTFTIQEITKQEPVLFYEYGNYVGQIVIPWTLNC